MTRLSDALARGLDYRRSAADIHGEFLEQSLEFRDLFSPPALTSVAGLALVARGARHIETLHGVNEIAAGRSFDLLDGFLARALSNESDIAGLTDVVADKIAAGIIIKSAWHKNIIPKPTLTTIAGANLYTSVLTSLAKYRHPSTPLRPSPSGKHSMALYTTSMLSYAYASALESEHPHYNLHPTLQRLAQTAFLAGTVYAGVATKGYAARIA